MANNGQRDDNAPVVLRIKLRYDDEDLFVNRLAHYINDVGLFLRSPRPKPLGTRLIILFKLANGSSILECEGRVRWIRPADDAQEQPGMGVEFSRLSPATRPILQRILAARAELGYQPDHEIPYSPEGFSLAAKQESAREAAPAGMPSVAQESATTAASPKPAAPVVWTLPKPAAVSEPVVSEPVVSEPVVSEPVVSEPVVSEPVMSEVAETEAVETEPAETVAAETEPAGSEPAGSEPVASEAAETEPVASEAAETEPVASEAAETGVAIEADASEPAAPEQPAPEPDNPANLASRRPPSRRDVPAARAPRNNHHLTTAAMLARARQEIPQDPGTDDADLEAMLAGEMADLDLQRVLARARALASEVGDDDLDSLLDAPGVAGIDIPTAGLPRPGAARRSRPSPQSSPRMPTPVAQLREREPRLEDASVPAAIPDQVSDDISAPDIEIIAERVGIPLSELGAAGPVDDLLPVDSGIPLSELGPSAPVLGRAGSEAEYDDDDFPEIETLDQTGPSLGFLHVGSMSGADSARMQAPARPAFDRSSSPDSSPRRPFDAEGAGNGEDDDNELDLDAMLDNADDDSAADDAMRADSEGAMERTHDLDPLTASGPSGLELALQDDALIGPGVTSSPRIIAPPEAGAAAGDSTMVMSDMGESAGEDFDAASRRSMSLAFDARALDADSILSSDMDELSRRATTAADNTQPGVEQVQPRKPPLQAPPPTASMPAAVPEETPASADDSDGPIELLDLDDDGLVVLDDDISIEMDEGAVRPPPPPVPVRPPPPPMAVSQGMTPEEYESALDEQEAAARAEAADMDGDGDGDDDKGSKKRGFFRRLFNK